MIGGADRTRAASAQSAAKNAVRRGRRLEKALSTALFSCCRKRECLAVYVTSIPQAASQNASMPAVCAGSSIS